MENTYIMLMTIKHIITGETSDLTYKLNTDNKDPLPIVAGWNQANYLVQSFTLRESI
jgi:hypothetical protein